MGTAAASLLLVATVDSCGRGDTKSGGQVGTPTPSGTTSATTTSPGSGTPTTADTTSSPAGPSAGDGYRSIINTEVVDNPKLDKFEQATKGRRAKTGLPGASLLVIQPGKVVQQEAWGQYTIETAVPITSGSKWLSAAPILTPVDEGEIDLDKPISTYLDFTNSDVGAINMRQLLSFTSGLPDDDSIPCTKDGTITLEACNREIGQLVIHTPGEAFRYGGLHLHLAAGVAEGVTGKTFAELFAERLTGPLGMTQTVFLESKFRVANGLAKHPSPAGTGVSSLGDYGKFLEMISHEGLAPSGTRILRAETVAEMQKNQIEGTRYAKAAAFRMDEKNPYGLGNWLHRADAEAMPSSCPAMVRSGSGRGSTSRTASWPSTWWRTAAAEMSRTTPTRRPTTGARST